MKNARDAEGVSSVPLVEMGDIATRRRIETACLIAVLAIAAGLRLWRLEDNGFGNTYYAAGVRSLLQGWWLFFYNAFDPAGFISLDKPPLAFWIQAVFARVLGYSGWAIHLPQALAGVASVAILHHLVRRPFGAIAALIAALLLALTPIAVAVARAIEHSRLGYGFAAIRDDELAAEASGVPTLRLKLIATALSGGFMGMAGAPLPYYVTYLDPSSGFSLSYAVNTIAMPLIGGTSMWLGPVLGAVLLGTLQQAATVTISSALSLLIVGVLLVVFVIAAPKGIIGWFRR